jgi:hypothetical protein
VSPGVWISVVQSGPSMDRNTDQRRTGILQFAYTATFSRVERVTGIEPALSAWESDMDPRSVLPGRI